ncbi:MAG: rRNA pseudouridine synthase [Candidatus Marinimicrobia bacterium]|nr:rRNA pseudouridine synthase [Candidatus Neomarinimicrobiota bacterium]
MKKKKKQGQRINKYLSLCGIGSRRKCEKYIKSGQVSVNSKVVKDFSTYVKPEDTVKLNGEPVEPEKKTYIILNKPAGMITTLEDPRDRSMVGDLFENEPFVKPVGRLDKDTTGVLLLTNDGDLLYKLTHPKFQVPKKYVVTVKGLVKKSIGKQLARGVELEDGEIARGRVVKINLKQNRSIITLILREGKNREIRRIFATLGHEVHKLDRVSFATITYKNLKRGEWRYLSQREVRVLSQVVD